MASGPACATNCRSRANSSRDGRSSTWPSASVLSFTPKRNLSATSGADRSKKKSYSRGRAWRPISMTSSNPAVVIRATRAPFLCSRALVPTVVPCRRVTPAPASIFFRAAAIARDGSSGVENTFSVLSKPPSTHTQSVKVPPVSMAMRNAGRDALAIGWKTINREDYHCRVPNAVVRPFVPSPVFGNATACSPDCRILKMRVSGSKVLPWERRGERGWCRVGCCSAWRPRSSIVRC